MARFKFSSASVMSRTSFSCHRVLIFTTSSMWAFSRSTAARLHQAWAFCHQFDTVAHVWSRLKYQNAVSPVVAMKCWFVGRDSRRRRPVGWRSRNFIQHIHHFVSGMSCVSREGEMPW
jgi:hypothetical protein